LIEVAEYTIDPNKPGIYNKEPYYQKDNSYVHVILERVVNKDGKERFSSRPKYFYDADGYLMKVDLVGLNYPGDIRLFYYE
jgi:hypothetical protein